MGRSSCRGKVLHIQPSGESRSRPLKVRTRPSTDRVILHAGRILKDDSHKDDTRRSANANANYSCTEMEMQNGPQRPAQSTRTKTWFVPSANLHIGFSHFFLYFIIVLLVISELQTLIPELNQLFANKNIQFITACKIL